MALGSWATGHSTSEIGVLGVMMSVLAMTWNFIFNYLFDQWDLKNRNMAPRGALIRVAHALLFEAGLLFFGLFIAAWWLALSYWDAFLLDVSISAFFLVYAYVFNWSYDLVFPVPRPKTPPVSS